MTPKRLGDGAYEEQLVMNQVTQLTGKTFLGAYTDNLSEYTALMQSGAQVARQFGLTVGVGLTADQMSKLTGDMVWLVNQTVTLPDGTQQTVLVPKLYLAQSDTVNLKASGALVAGNTVNLNATDAVVNSGTVAGSTATTVAANNVLNLGTIGTGGTTTVTATQDVINLGGSIGGTDTQVTAGNDIVNQSTTLQAAVNTGNGSVYSNATGMAIQSVGTISGAHNVALAAGRDVDLYGAAVQSGADTSITAGRNLDASTLTLTATQDAGTTDGLNGGHFNTTTHVGSTITTGGNLTTVSGGDTTLTDAALQADGDAALLAGGNLTVTAAKDTSSYNGQSMGGSLFHHKDSTYDETVQGTGINAGGSVTLAAGQGAGATGNLSILGSSVTTGGADGTAGGAVNLQSTGDIAVGTVAEEHDAQHWSQGNSSGFLSHEQVTDASTSQQSLAVGSTVFGDTAGASAGHDLFITGSTVGATNNVALAAQGNIGILAAQNTASYSSFHDDKKSGLFGSGGLGFTVGSSEQKEQYNTSSVAESQSRSTVGSVQGNVSISAGKNVHVGGSDIVAGKAATDTTGATGNIGITGQNVTIDPSQDSAQAHDRLESHASGFTVGLTGTLFDTARNLGANASSGTLFQRSQGIGNELGASAFDTPSISLSYSNSSSSSASDVFSTTQSGSTVRGGGNVSVIATGGAVKDASGNPLDGDIAVIGSTVTAGGAATFQSNRNTTFQASTDQFQQNNQSSNSTTEFALDTPSLGDHLRWAEGGSNSSGISPSPYNASRDSANGNTAQTRQTATVVTGNSVVVKSDTGDINVIGSGLSGTQGVNLVATKGAINVSAGTNTDVNGQQSSGSRFGSLGSNGSGTGFSVGVGHNNADQNTAAQTQSTIRSQIVSTNGNVGLAANQDVTIQGSDLAAGKDLTLVGKNVNLLPGVDATQSSIDQTASQYGVTLALGGTVGNAVATVNQMMAQSAAAKDPKLAGLQTVQAGLAAYGAYQAATASQASSPSLIKVTASVGGGSSSSDAQNSTTTVDGSTLAAGGTATLVATGSGAQDGDINAVGAQISGQDVTLSAARDVNLTSAQNMTQDASNNSSSNASLGVGFGLGGTQNGFTLEVAANGSKGNANGNSAENVNTQVLAANTVSITSNRDTNLIGAQATGNMVDVSAGRNLTITSPQDISAYNSQQTSMGFQMSLCVPPFCYGQTVSGSASASDQRINSNFLSVGQQSGIYAGSGGFNVDVGNHTQLNGGVVASSNAAILNGLNSLTTGTLGYVDLQNHASYSGQQIDFGGGYAGGHAQVSSTALSASGSEDSVTRSAISGGTLTVANSAAQQQLTGQTAAQAEAGISRDTNNTAGTLAVIFDKDRVQDRFQIADLVVSQVRTFVAIEAARADEAQAAANDPSSTPEQRAAAQQQADQINAQWGPSGSYRQVLTALTVAAGGNVTGGLGEFAQNAAVAYFQELGANGVKQIVNLIGSDGTPQGEAARAAMQAVVGCAGAAASSQDCGAGAVGAAASSILNSLLGSSNNLTVEERNARVGIVNSLVASIASSTGFSVSAASDAAWIETENNGASGTPGNNQVQNKQFRSIVVELGLSKSQARELHDEITGENLSYQEILERAVDMFGSGND